MKNIVNIKNSDALPRSDLFMRNRIVDEQLAYDEQAIIQTATETNKDDAATRTTQHQGISNKDYAAMGWGRAFRGQLSNKGRKLTKTNITRLSCLSSKTVI